MTDIVFERPPGFFQGEFNKTSPQGRIPVLAIDGDVMPESEVIAEYLEECYHAPSLLGASSRARAQVRTVSRIADIYLMNNIFMALPQVRRTSRLDAIRDLFMAQLTRGINALEHYLGVDHYAAGNSQTLADRSLLPALFMCEHVAPTLDVDNPIPGRVRTAAYWQWIQQDPNASRVLAEMTHGLAERRAGRG